jgi:bacillithiol system protein YtxJ
MLKADNGAEGPVFLRKKRFSVTMKTKSNIFKEASTMARIRRLMTLEDWEDALRGSKDKPLLVFKHSTQCSVSAGAHEEWLNYTADAGTDAVDYAIVHVIEERPVSNAIAESLGVTHKSPQVILVRDGKAVWDESHWRITYDFFRERLGEPKAG